MTEPLLTCHPIIKKQGRNSIRFESSLYLSNSSSSFLFRVEPKYYGCQNLFSNSIHLLYESSLRFYRAFEFFNRFSSFYRVFKFISFQIELSRFNFNNFTNILRLYYFPFNFNVKILFFQFQITRNFQINIPSNQLFNFSIQLNNFSISTIHLYFIHWNFISPINYVSALVHDDILTIIKYESFYIMKKYDFYFLKIDTTTLIILIVLYYIFLI